MLTVNSAYFLHKGVVTGLSLFGFQITFFHTDTGNSNENYKVDLNVEADATAEAEAEDDDDVDWEEG